MLRDMKATAIPTTANPVVRFWRTYPLIVLATPMAVIAYVAFEAARTSNTGARTDAVIAIAAGLVVLLGIVGVAPAFFREQFRRSGILSVDQMDGVTFEHRLESLYEFLGYTVETTKTSGDFGADLVLVKNGERTVVQAKRYSSNVGLEAIQESVAAKAMYQATKAVVATNSYYTKAARELAAANNVELIERPQLTAMLSDQAGTLGERTGARLLAGQVLAGIRPVTFVVYSVVRAVLQMAAALVGMLFGRRTH